jgi:membrane-associated phospholipid phosphatase
MMLWLGVLLLAAGLPLLLLDRKAARYFRAHVQPPLLTVLIRTTDYAKGGFWLAAVALIYAGTQIGMAVTGETPALRWANDAVLGLLGGLVAGSIVLHTVKLFLGRRRPRDDFEHDLYGFLFFRWELEYNSFPSGHALTIFCLATWASALFPAFTALWFAIAGYLALTRALLAVHFLSDVAVGAGIGVIATREFMVFAFPQLVPSWY